MLYSVFDWNTLSYRYYQSGDGPAPGLRAKPRRKYPGGNSVRPEDVLPLLPADAVEVGQGSDARGRIAVTPEVAAASAGAADAAGLTGFGGYDFSTTSPYVKLGLVVAAAWLAIHLLFTEAKKL